MIASPPTRNDQLASQRSAMKIITAVSRRITVRKGVIEVFAQDFDCSRNACRRWIPSSIFGLAKICFSAYKSLRSVTFEPDSKLQRIDESAFAGSALAAIILPKSVEVLCKQCFYDCKSLRSITFESDSKLQRIEDFVFQLSALASIIIPKSVEVLCKQCFYNCKSLRSVTFESDSKLQRIDESAFERSALTSIIVRKSVEVLCKQCFSACKSLPSVPFQLGSKLCEVAANAFALSPRLRAIEYPSSLLERSGAAVPPDTGTPLSSIADEE
jgi:hypothetical protein